MVITKILHSKFYFSEKGKDGYYHASFLSSNQRCNVSESTELQTAVKKFIVSDCNVFF